MGAKRKIESKIKQKEKYISEKRSEKIIMWVKRKILNWKEKYRNKKKMMKAKGSQQINVGSQKKRKNLCKSFAKTCEAEVKWDSLWSKKKLKQNWCNLLPKDRCNWCDNLGHVADNANRRIPVSHKSPPGDLNLWPLWREANRLVMWDCRLSTGLPPSSRLCGCETRRETCSERNTGTGKLCEIKWDCHIVGTRA